MTSSQPTKWSRSRDLWACLTLAAVTLAVYAQSAGFEFVRWDDPYYPQNSHLHGGFSMRAIQWAFTTGEQGNWHPLTWLSHLLDYQLFGPAPGPAHISGVIIHVLAALALFAFLRRATQTYWRSALVAFVFALHPLHVQSVAWVSERKDVLCALFWFLTSLAWVRYTERPSQARYLIPLAAFAMGVLSKPMIVTLPIVLILLDLWPLNRPRTLRLVYEKVPFLVISAVASGITYVVQQRGGTVKALSQFPLTLRLENALTSWIIYIGKMLWPTRLAFIYPYPEAIPLWWALLAGAILVTVSVLVVRLARSYPYLAVGWFWYIVTTLPVIGFVQVGIQSRADRYLYIPMVGLTIMLAWGCADLIRRWPVAKPWVAGTLGAACLAMIPVTWVEAGYWRNDVSLFGHAIDVGHENFIAYHNLAVALSLTGRASESIPYFDAELRLNPGSSMGHSDRGEALWKLGRKEEAIAEFRKAITLDPPYPEAHVNYGSALAIEGKLDEAIDEYRAALRIVPDERAYYNLGIALLQLGQYDESIRNFDRAQRLNPENPAIRNNRGTALGKQGKWAEAIVDFDAALQLNPEYGEASRNLGEALMKTGRMEEAAANLQAAARLRPGDAVIRNLLGFALAATPGGIPEATAQLKEAVRLDPSLASAQENLGRLLAQNPATAAEAIPHIEVALRLSPSGALAEYLAQLKKAPVGTR